jgi:hypothetical protein
MYVTGDRGAWTRGASEGVGQPSCRKRAETRRGEPREMKGKIRPECADAQGLGDREGRRGNQPLAPPRKWC